MIRLVLAAAVVLAPASAFAHAHLQSAVPPVGGTVARAPTEVAITYSEPVEPRFSAIAVHDAAGARVDDGPPQTAPGDGHRLSVPFKALPPGVSAVEWHVTSVDTHKTEGKFTFTVQPRVPRTRCGRRARRISRASCRSPGRPCSARSWRGRCCGRPRRIFAATRTMPGTAWRR